ncbi:ribose 5-phosphate isomerase B [Chloroflexota bacterium]
MKLKVALGADHGGFSLKEELKNRLQKDHDILDLGATKLIPDDDYPDYVRAVIGLILSGKADRGLIICGSGVGACVAANKYGDIRAGLCHDTYSARQGVEHDNINVLCLGARVIGIELATELAGAFLEARFSDAPRHRRRLDKINALEQ